MQNQKLSISIPGKFIIFIEQYKAAHHINSRSEVITNALTLLEQQELQAEYKEAYSDLGEYNDLEFLAGEGLEHEAW